MRILEKSGEEIENLMLTRNVSFTAKGIYSYLLLKRHPEETTSTGLAIVMRENEDRMLSALKELQAVGFVGGVQ